VDIQEFNRDDLEYVMDLDLVIRGPSGLEIASHIYREVIPRELFI
jgi:hypothetical protein